MGFPARIPRKFIKTVTLSAVAGAGAVGTVAIATVTGSVLLTQVTARGTTSLTGATATIELGVAGNTAAIIAQATATNLTAGKFWNSATPATGVKVAVVDLALTGNVILTVATADVTAGVIEIVFYWLPLSDNGAIS